MIVRMVQFNNNDPVCFQARFCAATRRIMNEVLTPMVDNFTPMHEMAAKSDFTIGQINRWARYKYNMTISQLYKIRQNEKLEKEFIEHRKNRTPLKEMAKIYGHNKNWVNRRYIEFGMDTIGGEKNKLMDDNIPWMLQAGYTVKMMQEQLKVSVSTIQKWVYDNLGCGMNKYRRAHNIKRKYNG